AEGCTPRANGRKSPHLNPLPFKKEERRNNQTHTRELSQLNARRAILRLRMRVLAIDASLRHSGVAIVDANNGKPRSVYFGTIHNASSMRSSSCLVAIRDRLIELIREHEPDCCALESVIYVQSYKTAIVLGAARGAAILAAAENGLPIFEYAPKRIKQATVGTGSDGKNQVAFMMRALLGLTETPDADSADALAIALTHLRAQEAARLGIPGATQLCGLGLIIARG